GRPYALLVGGRSRACSDGYDPVPHLDFHLRMRKQVAVPSRILRRAAPRRDDDVVVAVAPVDERELPGLAGLPTRRVEDQAMRAVPVVAHRAAGRLVLSDVLVTKETAVRHGTNVPRARARGDPSRPGSTALREGGKRDDKHRANTGSGDTVPAPRGSAESPEDRLPGTLVRE